MLCTAKPASLRLVLRVASNTGEVLFVSAALRSVVLMLPSENTSKSHPSDVLPLSTVTLSFCPAPKPTVRVSTIAPETLVNDAL